MTALRAVSRLASAFVLLAAGSADAFSPFPGKGTDETAKIHALKVKKNHTAEETLLIETYNGATPGPGKGGVYGTKVYKLTEALTVYRVFTGANARARIGSWWSHSNPKGQTKADYRKNYAICHDWNPDMDTMVKCTLEVGTILAYGAGEAVKAGECADHAEHYAKDTLGKWMQIYLHKPFANQTAKIVCEPAAQDVHRPLE